MALALLALPLLLSSQAGNPLPVSGSRGMVVSDEPLASEIGARILRKGGNAVDAAIAVGFAMAVVQPTAGNIGGGGFMLVRMADGRTAFIDYRERAPRAAHRDMYAGSPRASLDGLTAGGVPGTVAGFEHASRTYGRLKWRDLVQPAFDLASRGFAISGSQARALSGAKARLSKFPDTNRFYLNNGKLFAPGDRVRLPDLAKTLGRVRNEGAKGFYQGETAKLIAEDMRRRGGLITEQDLLDYKVQVREPLTGTYRGHTIITAPPPSSGGAVLLQITNILEGAPADSYGAASRYHLLIEAMKLAFADRAELMGDPDYVKVPIARLISPAYAANQRARISLDTATSSTDIKPGIPPTGESDQTTHFSIVDSQGNAVANTYTINGSFGSGDTIIGTGILLNNEMDDFAAQPGKPNLYGLIQGERNAIQPGKRPLSSMTPTIVLRDGKLFLVVGSPGGPTIINTVLQIILNVIDHDMDIQEAVQAPRIHHQWLPDVTNYERPWLSPDTLADLRKRGHSMRAQATSQGIANCIQIDLATGRRLGAADTRYVDAKAVSE